jgi:putative pre-16S rRNA nuclease
MSDRLPNKGRLAGVDFGTRRIGIAICDATQRLASPLDNYTRGSKGQDADYFRRIVKGESVVGWVVGLPVHMSGDESEKSLEAREFGKWLEIETELPVTFYDERFSTAIADEFLAIGKLTKKKRQQRRDMLAAQVILASYLESDRSAANIQAIDE